MSISPARMILQIAYGEASTASPPDSPRPASSPSANTKARENTPSSSPAVSTAKPVTTNLRIDDQHQFYYEFVDGSSGNVMFEIPPAALRAIGESLNLPRNGEPGPHTLDVKS